MKIVFVSSLFPPTFIGGAEILTQLIAQALAHRGHKVIVYTGGKNKKRVVDGVQIKEIKELVSPKPFKSFFMPLYSYILKRRLIKEKDILTADIIQATDSDTILALSGWKKIQKKLIATIQEYGLICPDGNFLYGKKACPGYCHKGKGFLCLNNKKLSRLQKLYFQFAYSFRKYYRDKKLLLLDKGICVSHFVEKEVLKINKSMKTAVISNCFPQNWEKVKNKKNKRDIDVLYVGHLVPYKGIEFLLRALTQVLAKKNSKIFFVGSGELKSYQKMAISLGIGNKINFVGEVDFSLIKNYYQRAKIIVVPSLWPEPCGRAIIEGMFWGGVVIGTNVGGTPESIIHKKSGFLVPPGSVKELAKTILYLLNNKKARSSISQYAKKHVRNIFSSQKIALLYEKFYNLHLGNK